MVGPSADLDCYVRSDVLVMDLHNSVVDDPETMTLVRAALPPLSVVLLTAHEDVTVICHAPGSMLCPRAPSRGRKSGSG